LLRSCSTPLSQNRSVLKSELARIEVLDARWSCDSVADREELAGSSSVVSRLPQYLMTAMLIGAEQVAS